MKRTCALALVACAATVYTKEVSDATSSSSDPKKALDKAQKKWNIVRDIVYFMGQTWDGMYLGLYGPSGAAEKIDEDCFGEWIPDDMEFIVDYFYRLGKDFWSITYEDSTQLSYDIVDLIFLNDQYCHFR